GRDRGSAARGDPGDRFLRDDADVDELKSLSANVRLCEGLRRPALLADAISIIFSLLKAYIETRAFGQEVTG
ncbi:MAG: hypothetical protein K2O98_12675, partial [Lachnospiraceae bacterium]|nr:hypothetical protein [Lachnospiraceae bacterium]